ncbi:MAG TPA: type II CAAX endopeptidase family protein [Edaphobacter sp.]|nr:type II CAAX endopeptidase family protein [Edaphobacter sp.]
MHSLDSISQRRSERLLQFALFVTSVSWFLASDTVAGRASRGISQRFSLDASRPLLTSIFLLFLLAVGFSILQTIAKRTSSLREVLGLPRRPTAGREWLLGVALGWGLIVLAILPMTLAGTLDIQFWTQSRAFGLLLLNLLTIAIAALVEEVAFRGYPFRRLIEAIGPVAATIVMSLFFGFLHILNPNATLTSTAVTVLAGVLLSLAWLRTHGLWLGWGLHFAWNASMGILFGLPISGINDFASIVETRTVGHLGLTGGSYGPEGSAFTAIVLLIGVVILVRVTRDYAWHYTYVPIVPAGYPMEAAPPAAHIAMEKQAQQATTAAPVSQTSLVQILPATPQSRSVEDESRS